MAQAIGYRSYYYLSLKKPANQLIDWILKIINSIETKHLPIIRQQEQLTRSIQTLKKSKQKQRLRPSQNKVQ